MTQIMHCQVFPTNREIKSSAVFTPEMEAVAIPNTTNVRRAAHFPLIIHTMWKNPNSPPPAETLRWKKVMKVNIKFHQAWFPLTKALNNSHQGCRAVNPSHDFRLYYDAELLDFVQRSYPEYLALFLSLKGVYMADMARVLMIYHYGGIYMDLDFYCHRFLKSAIYCFTSSRHRMWLPHWHTGSTFTILGHFHASLTDFFLRRVLWGTRKMF